MPSELGGGEQLACGWGSSCAEKLFGVVAQARCFAEGARNGWGVGRGGQSGRKYEEMSAKLYQIEIVGGSQFACSEEERVLFAMERRGLSDIGVGCRGGGCGFCRVRVVEGEYKTGKMSVSKISPEDQAKGFVLACRLYPLEDLKLEVEQN